MVVRALKKYASNVARAIVTDEDFSAFTGAATGVATGFATGNLLPVPVLYALGRMVDVAREERVDGQISDFDKKHMLEKLIHPLPARDFLKAIGVQPQPGLSADLHYSQQLGTNGLTGGFNVILDLDSPNGKSSVCIKRSNKPREVYGRKIQRELNRLGVPRVPKMYATYSDVEKGHIVSISEGLGLSLEDLLCVGCGPWTDLTPSRFPQFPGFLFPKVTNHLVNMHGLVERLRKDPNDAYATEIFDAYHKGWPDWNSIPMISVTEKLFEAFYSDRRLDDIAIPFQFHDYLVSYLEPKFYSTPLLEAIDEAQQTMRSRIKTTFSHGDLHSGNVIGRMLVCYAAIEVYEATGFIDFDKSQQHSPYFDFFNLAFLTDGIKTKRYNSWRTHFLDNMVDTIGDVHEEDLVFIEYSIMLNEWLRYTGRFPELQFIQEDLAGEENEKAHEIYVGMHHLAQLMQTTAERYRGSDSKLARVHRGFIASEKEGVNNKFLDRVFSTKPDGRENIDYLMNTYTYRGNSRVNLFNPDEQVERQRSRVLDYAHKIGLKGGLVEASVIMASILGIAAGVDYSNILAEQTQDVFNLLGTAVASGFCLIDLYTRLDNRIGR